MRNSSTNLGGGRRYRRVGVGSRVVLTDHHQCGQRSTPDLGGATVPRSDRRRRGHGLDNLLADGCTLTHITGYVQPSGEWLSQMRAGRFLYHGIEEKRVTVEVEGNTAHVSGRFITDATVYGTRANWRLQMTMGYAREDDMWSVVRSAAATW
ncbi:nuclear transport factor 2 family protein [Streptomyces canus]|uniref:nuclear transport factor 2 family protein n=1 Tax=Streptomyces canus TaxID=58343 RepID=UPI0033AE1D5F